MKRAGFVAALLVLLLAAFGFKGGLVTLPEVPAKAAPGTFDTGRALARLRRILGDQRPHPVDSAASDSVRGRLVAELRALGLNPRVTDDFTCNGAATGQTVSCARIRNVVATLGPAQGRHVLLVSHYNSTPTGPGAADDGIGIASMLEVAFLLKDRPLMRPVSFLFDEGEETGLIGARAFLDRDPLAARVDSLVNLGIARHHRPGDHVRDQPSQRRRDSPLRPFRRSAGGQFDDHGFLAPDPQPDRRRRVQGAALDHPQLRHHRQRDALSQPRRQDRQPRPAKPSPHGRTGAGGDGGPGGRRPRSPGGRASLRGCPRDRPRHPAPPARAGPARAAAARLRLARLVAARRPRPRNKRGRPGDG